MILEVAMLGRDKKKGSSADPTAISTLLGRDIVIEGTLSFKETIRVDGCVRGKLISEKGTLIVGEHSTLDADIQVGVAIVRGKINGRMEAAQRIEIHAPAQINGDIFAPSVTIDTGVVFNGNCTMHTQITQVMKSAESPSKTNTEEADGQKVVKKL
jgi:cytoskeletal protein CcmA (bactofilin family)